MTETQRRIRAYKRALPHMWERVTAAAMLLIMSISMMISASFAWITLSRSPEISGMATTISTNGNLEIALSGADGLEPDPTAVGDGGQDVTLSNLTWGNLVNLSNAAYGLEELTLRPAILNTGSLLRSPLRSVTYGSDGRIADIISDFAFTNYGEKDGAYAFFVPENGETQYGVRAISSVTYSSVSGDAQLLSLSSAITKAQSVAVLKFQTLYGNKDYMNSITNLAGVYLQYRMDDVDQDCTGYVELIYEMMGEYAEALTLTGETILATANLHHFIYCNQNNETYSAFTLADLNNGSVKTTLAGEGITLTAMDTYLKDYETFFGENGNDGLYVDYETNVYNVWKQGTSIGWELIRNYINPMANINTATINGTAAQSIGASDLAKLAFASSKVCELKSGLIWDMDKLLGTKLSVTNVSVTAMGINLTLNEIRTSAATPFYIVDDVKAADQKAAAGGLAATDAVAADTYGMAVDFWVRTNAVDALLMLEGELITETVVLTDEEGNPLTDDNGNPVIETIVTGYAGANRIWEENDPELPVLGTSASQGSGSCYIFYPESPEEQAQALEMLRAMCVAFVDADGELLAQADLDTVNAIEDQGRVLVPLQLRAKTIPSVDEEGNEVLETSYHITELEQNEPMRVTAIVYMDGSRLGNSQVLSSGSIKGQLNIQFGTSEDIQSMDDAVKDKFFSFILSADKTEFDGFNVDNPPTTTLSLAISGMEATSVKANFVSYISTTQGVRQPEFSFTKQEEGGWTADVTFSGPGTFQLRSIQVDGVDYLLDQENRVTVYIPGVTVSSVSCEGWGGSNSYAVMTADTYYKQPITMYLNVGTGMSSPKSLQGVFAHESGQNVTVNFTQTNNGWIADPTFTTSGTYTLNYVIIDGTYVALDFGMQKTLQLTLGLQARIFLSQPATESYLIERAALEAVEATEIEAVRNDSSLTDTQKQSQIEAITANYKAQYDALLAAMNGEDGLDMQITGNGYQFIYDGSEHLFMDVSVMITDDKGNIMSGLTDVEIHYGIGASVVNRLDSDLIWNKNTSRYEGEFELASPGMYGFQNLEVGENVIYSAISAPRVAAISPTPISYVGKSADYVSYYEEINANASRKMSVVLKDSPSAIVKLTLQHTEEGIADQTYEITEMATAVDNLDGTYTYFVDVPNDGTWKIVAMQVAQAFYNEVYYDGSDEEGATGWLDWTEKVLADNIVTEFFTTVNFSANANPNAAYDIAFMDGKKFPAMTITLTDYLGNALDNVSVDLKYTWDSASKAFSASNESNLPGTQYGGENLASSDGKNFSLGDVTFLLDGTYYCDFAITINDVEYTNLTHFTVPENGGFSANHVDINWTQPDVKFTAINPAEGTTFDVHTSGSGSSAELTSMSNSIDDEYSVTAYFSAVKESGLCSTSVKYTASTATVALSGAGKYESATVTIDGDTDMTFSFANGSASASSQVGSANGTSRGKVGTGRATKINLVHGGVTYTVDLSHTLTVNNPY